MDGSITAAQQPAERVTARALAKQKTHDKVLAAARRLFLEHGYDAATIRDIAEAAGMSTGAVFASFEDKEDLLATILTEHLGQMAGHMAKMAKPGIEPAAVLGRAFAFEYLSSHFPMALLREHGMAHSSPAIGKCLRDARQVWTDFARRILEPFCHDASHLAVVCELICDAHVGTLWHAELHDSQIEARKSFEGKLGAILFGVIKPLH